MNTKKLKDKIFQENIDSLFQKNHHSQCRFHSDTLESLCYA